MTFPLLLLALLLSCTTGAHTITYEITGVAIETSVLYHNEYGDAEAFSRIKLPWTKTFDIEFRDDSYYGGKLPGGVFPALVSATSVNRMGSLEAAIYVNGELVARATTTANSNTAEARYGVKLR